MNMSEYSSLEVLAFQLLPKEENAVSIKVIVHCPILSIKLIVLIKGNSKKPSTYQSFSLSVCNPTEVRSCRGLESAIRCCILKFNFKK